MSGVLIKVISPGGSADFFFLAEEAELSYIGPVSED